MSFMQSVTSRIRWYHIAGLVVLVVVVAGLVWWWLDRNRAARIESGNTTDSPEGLG